MQTNTDFWNLVKAFLWQGRYKHGISWLSARTGLFDGPFDGVWSKCFFFLLQLTNIFVTEEIKVCIKINFEKSNEVRSGWKPWDSKHAFLFLFWTVLKQILTGIYFSWTWTINQILSLTVFVLLSCALKSLSINKKQVQL